MFDYTLFGMIFIFGTLIGSFLNVVIYRLPRGLSVVSGSSRCPACDTPIPLLLNIPIISYLLLRAKCRSCKAQISWRYPVVELLTGVMFMGIVELAGSELAAVRLATLGCILIAVSLIDGEYRLIPDRVIKFGLLAAFALALADGFASFYASLFGFLVGGGLFLFFWFLGRVLLRKDGMGGGDIKLAALVGAFLGWKLFLLAFFLSFVLVFLFGMVGILFKRMNRKTEIPMAPFISAGVLAALTIGDRLISWYLLWVKHI